jgi:antitoxin ParD1/3/4
MADQNSDESARNSLEQLLLEGLDSGEPIEVTSAFWEQHRAELLRRQERQEEKAGD